MELSNKHLSEHRTEQISVTTEMFNIQVEAGQVHTQMNGNSYRQITCIIVVGSETIIL